MSCGVSTKGGALVRWCQLDTYHSMRAGRVPFAYLLGGV